MKLSHINVSNFQGLRAAALQITTPVVVVVGPNGSGKSSLRDAVSMAMNGKPIRVSLKKDFADLVHDGQKTGHISLEFEGGRKSSVSLPDGKTEFFGTAEGVDPNKARAGLAYVLDPSLFAFAEADDRRQLLYTLTGCDISGEEVSKRLAARGADAAKIDTVLPLVRAGLQVAEDDARNRAREAKGAWRGVTGEAYGDKKAEGWKDHAEPVAAGAIAQAEQGLAAVDAEIASAQQTLGELRAKHQAGSVRAAKVTQLTDLAGKVSGIEKRMAVDEQDLASLRDQVAAISVGTAPRNGLVHDLARALNDMAGEEQPLGCERPAYVQACQALDLYEDAHGALVDEGAAADPAKVAQLPQLQQSLAMMERAVANGHRDLKAARDAATQLQALQGEEGAEEVTAEQVTAAAERINVLQASRKKLAADLAALQEYASYAAEAGKKTAAAATHHADVQAWALIADALAPDGIPGEILADALRPVNDLLHDYAKLAGWARVQIDRDMAITADGRAYVLLSESEKWRVDCLIGLVAANLSTLKLVLLDRFDVLDMAGRKDMIALLDELAYQGDIDSAMVCGTLKQPPALPDTMQVFWVNQGEVVAVQREEERAAA
jgi:hypothetical protein